MPSKVLRYYAEGSRSGWEAFCVDLDLAVQGDSFEDVYRSLSEAIVVYCESVAELEDEADRARLMNRQAPLSTRLRLAWRHLRYFLHGWRDSRISRHDFITTAELCQI